MRYASYEQLGGLGGKKAIRSRLQIRAVNSELDSMGMFTQNNIRNCQIRISLFECEQNISLDKYILITFKIVMNCGLNLTFLHLFSFYFANKLERF